jgi:hypothetical protein
MVPKTIRCLRLPGSPSDRAASSLQNPRSPTNTQARPRNVRASKEPARLPLLSSCSTSPTWRTPPRASRE